jgi:hypothetical protein
VYMERTRWLKQATNGPKGVVETLPPMETLGSFSFAARGLFEPSITSQMSTTKL